MEFNSMQELPADDEQAELALRCERQDDLADGLCGIYRCKRKLGSSVLDAYRVALQAYIDACEKARQEEKDADAE